MKDGYINTGSLGKGRGQSEAMYPGKQKINTIKGYSFHSEYSIQNNSWNAKLYSGHWISVYWNLLQWDMKNYTKMKAWFQADYGWSDDL